MLRSRSAFSDLKSAARAYQAWLTGSALPLWASVGLSRAGFFEEAITTDGVAVQLPHLGRVQARQTYLYTSAAIAGFGCEWVDVARQGYDYYSTQFRGEDGLFARLSDEYGVVIDPTPHLYEQAFSLLAMSTLHAAGSSMPVRLDSERALASMECWRLPGGGWREKGNHPFQANAHMHLLEAFLAWEEAGGGPAWAVRADQLVELAIRVFIDPEHGHLLEYFDEHWRPAPDGKFIEPGHQFEWAWLMEHWGASRGDPRGHAAALRLFDAGLKGVDPVRGVAVNSINLGYAPLDANARLWPQTEYLKASLILGRKDHALKAAEALSLYLEVPARGTWRDVMRPDGSFVEEAAPASSFYHIMCAILELRRFA